MPQPLGTSSLFSSYCIHTRVSKYAELQHDYLLVQNTSQGNEDEHQHKYSRDCNIQIQVTSRCTCGKIYIHFIGKPTQSYAFYLTGHHPKLIHNPIPTSLFSILFVCCECIRQRKNITLNWLYEIHCGLERNKDVGMGL